MTYDIEIAEFNSAGIRSEAEALGITHMRSIGGGYADGHEGQADYCVGFYALPHPQGWEFRVANTNANPVWEEADQQAFAELAESCGVELCDELQEKADRLARSFGQRLTPEQQQVKELTGFTMGHLQALRHLQQRAEIYRKAQK